MTTESSRLALITFTGVGTLTRTTEGPSSRGTPMVMSPRRRLTRQPPYSPATHTCRLPWSTLTPQWRKPIAERICHRISSGDTQSGNRCSSSTPRTITEEAYRKLYSAPAQLRHIITARCSMSQGRMPAASLVLFRGRADTHTLMSSHPKASAAN
jgi:hypothetical protein